VSVRTDDGQIFDVLIELARDGSQFRVCWEESVGMKK